MSITSFDIDGVSGNHYNANYNPHIDKYYKTKGSIIEAAGFVHGVPPGILELVHRLHTTPTILKVVCFSSGLFIRNDPFWMTLLKQALPRGKYHEIKEKVQIFSQQELSTVTKNEHHESSKRFQTQYAARKKKLQGVVSEELKNILHIDDVPEAIFPGEEANHLITKDSSHKQTSQTNGSQKIWLEANQACYIAGLLFTCIEIAYQESISVSEALFRIQFKETKEENTFKPIYSELMLQEPIYIRGLEELRKVNPDFTFVDKNSLSSSSSEKGDVLIQEIAKCMQPFKDHWEKKEYEQALKTIDKILDFVERKSGRWIESSASVCDGVVPLLKWVCMGSASLLTEVAFPVLLRILDIPLDSPRDECIKCYLSAVPQALRSQSLLILVQNDWEEKQYTQAFTRLSELSISCQSDQNFGYLETALKEICRLPLREEHYADLFLLIKNISQRSSRILCLHSLVHATKSHLAKVKIFCCLVQVYQEDNKSPEALKAFDQAIELLHTTDLVETNFSIVLTAVPHLGSGLSGQEINKTISAIKKIKNRFLRDMLLADCYSLLHSEQKFVAFYQLIIHSSSYTQPYILRSGLNMLEKSLKNEKKPHKEAVKLLLFLLSSYNENRWETFGMQDQGYPYENIRNLLYSLEPSVKKAKAFSNLSKIDWEKNHYECSLAIFPEILKIKAQLEEESHYSSPLIDSILFSLIFFQCRKNSFCSEISYLTIIETHFVGLLQEKAKALYSIEKDGNNVDKKSIGYNPQNTTQKVYRSLSSIRLWQQRDFENARYYLRNLDDNQLKHFAAVEISQLIAKNDEKLLEIISSISEPYLQLDALKTMQTVLHPSSEIKQEINTKLISCFWKLKRYKKAFNRLQQAVSFLNQSKCSFHDGNTFLAILKEIAHFGIPLEFSEKLLAMLVAIHDEEILCDALGEFILPLDNTHIPTLNQIDEHFKNQKTGEKTYKIYFYLTQKFWKFKDYDRAFEMMHSFLAWALKSTHLFFMNDFPHLVLSLTRKGIPESLQEKFCQIILQTKNDLLESLKYFLPAYNTATPEMLKKIKGAICEHTDSEEKNRALQALCLAYFRLNQSKEAFAVIDLFRHSKEGNALLLEIIRTLLNRPLQIEGHDLFYQYLLEIEDKQQQAEGLRDLLQIVPSEDTTLKAKIQQSLERLPKQHIYSGIYIPIGKGFSFF